MAAASSSNGADANPEQQQQGPASSSNGAQQQQQQQRDAAEAASDGEPDDEQPADAQEPTTETILGLLGKRTDKIGDGIADLRKKREELLKKRKALTRELKNSKRRKSRLAAKAKEMTNDDLLDVINMRLSKEKKNAEA